jgi:hypothetical protein
MNWSALTKKQQQMAIATAVLAVVQILILAHFLGWTKPASARGGSAKKELLELETKLGDARTILKREEMIRRELAQSVEKLDALAVYAPTFSDRYAWSYEYVSRCATQAGVELDSLEEVSYVTSGKESAAVAQPYEINVSTQCGYNALIEFLWRLEKDNPLMRIKEVTVVTLRGQTKAQQVRIVIQWPSSVKIERGVL